MYAQHCAVSWPVFAESQHSHAGRLKKGGTSGSTAYLNKGTGVWKGILCNFTAPVVCNTENRSHYMTKHYFSL